MDNLSPVLLTRITLPPLRDGLVRRPRLAEQLAPAPGVRLVLVAAPAGFGKTSLLTAWGHARVEDGSAVAWYALDARDNDPARFVAALLAALARALAGEADLQAARDALPGEDAEPALTLLVNALAALKRRCLLILDDYHLIASPAVHAAVGFLLAHLPPQVTLAIGTRTSPPLQLARLRAAGALIELRAADLRFTRDETRALLHVAGGRELPADACAAIDGLAEGWAAGLQLIGLMLRHGGSDLPTEETAALVGRLAGGQRDIFDYLSEEVFERQPAELRQLLLDTAVLSRLSAPLCAAVTGLDEGTAHGLIEQLDRANLFLVPLDAGRGWFRYHHLFAQFLADRLQRSQAGRAALLHRRASTWYEQAGELGEAITHALAGADYDRAAALVGQVADALWLRGELRTLTQWLEAFPEPLGERWPRLALCRAWLRLHTGQLGEAAALMADARRALEREGAGSGDSGQAAARGMLLALEAVLAANQGDPAGAAARARTAEEVLPPANLLWRGVAAIALGAATMLRGELEEARHAFSLAADLTERAGSVQLRLVAVRNLALMWSMQGRLGDALIRYTELWGLVARHGAERFHAAMEAHAEQALILFERNDLAGALAHAERALELGQQQDNPLVCIQGYVAHAEVWRAQGRLPEALAAAREAARLAEERGVPHLVPTALACQARLELRCGEGAVALGWAAEVAARLGERGPALPPYPGPWEASTLARLWLAEGRLDSATALLEQLAQVVAPMGRIGRLIELRALQAVAYEMGGNRERGLLALRDALALAEPEGFVRVFVDDDLPLGPLLEAVMYYSTVEAPARRFAQALLVARGGPQPLGDNPGAGELPEPLSEREREILGLVARGASNQEIADALLIARGTVKVHLHHILGKLGASSRTAAVARARALGLL